MADFVQTMKDWHRLCKAMTDRKPNNACDGCPLEAYGCSPVYEAVDSYRDVDFEVVGETISAWAAEHPEPVYETWFEYLLRIGVIPENAPAGGEYQWIVESIKHKHISNDIAESLKLHPKEVQA